MYKIAILFNSIMLILTVIVVILFQLKLNNVSRYDLNNDGKVDIQDASILMAHMEQ